MKQLKPKPSLVKKIFLVIGAAFAFLNHRIIVSVERNTADTVADCGTACEEAEPDPAEINAVSIERNKADIVADCGVACEEPEPGTKAVQDHDSYMKERDSNALILKKLNLSPLLIPPSYNGFMEPFWKCHDDAGNERGRSKKLIFVHIFKTAGSTFRKFMVFYGGMCQRGHGIVTKCSKLRSRSLPWQNRDGQQCVKGFARTRQGQELAGNSVHPDFLKEMDLIIGHFPLGVHEQWPDVDERHVFPQYVAFFREPIIKRVSGFLYMNKAKNWTLGDAVTEFRSMVLHEAGRAHYNGYTRYLLTPKQQDHLLATNGTRMDEVKLVQENLVTMRVLVGVVEHMGNSLSLLRSVIDQGKELGSSFSMLDDSRHLTEGLPHLNENKSRLSSKEIVSLLSSDEHFMSVMQEYLRYEYLIYDFALRLHILQVTDMHRMHGDGYSLDM